MYSLYPITTDIKNENTYLEVTIAQQKHTF